MQTEQLPLCALLSQALVAFTIELDNEADHRLPHRTSDFGSTSDGPGVPWMTSVAMYFNCMKYVPEDGITLRELHLRARTETNLAGMLRWGYVTVEPKPGPQKKDALIRPTRAGRRAKEVWQPLPSEIEDRWRARFGEPEMDALHGSLREMAAKLTLDLPDCLPILKYGLFTKGDFRRRADTDALPDQGLFCLLSRVLLAYALQFEARSDISLAISADVLRVIGEEGVRVRDLPALSGVSKEAIAMAVGFLKRSGFATLSPVPAPGRGDAVFLTDRGIEARGRYFSLTSAIDKRWPEHFGEEAARALRSSLTGLVGSPLFKCLTPYPDGWRAKIRPPAVLPHFPMVLHRGGYPDGS